jgi:hypothetical protein
VVVGVEELRVQQFEVILEFVFEHAGEEGEGVRGEGRGGVQEQ